VIEHAAILSDGPSLHVPPELLDDKRPGGRYASHLDEQLHENERQMIEDALAAAEGRVSGQLGAAVRLGVPASTLESKIRRFNIDKLRYRARLTGHA
jgi:formate hydrogenlyase transcriptional activator